MTNESSLIQATRDWLDRAAGDFMLLDPGDLPSMARFTKRLEKPDIDLESLDNPPGAGKALRDLLAQAATHVRSIILEETSDVNAAMTSAGEKLEAAQAITRGAPLQDRNIAQSETCAPVNVTSNKNASELSKTTEDSGYWMDPSIITAYVEQQAAVLPEMEQRVLDYEKKRDPEIMAELRRMLHTLKGESGVVGALTIEKVCHRMEDYLDGSSQDFAADVLLSVLDWINNAVNAFGGNTTEEPANAVLQLLDQAPEPESNQPAMEEPEQKETASVSIPITDKELAADFAAEAHEHFDTADENLMILEKESNNSDAIDAVFRAFHTIKGVAGFLGMGPLNDLAHAAETLLDEVRKGKRVFADSTVETTFSALDMLKILVADLREALTDDRDMRVHPECEKVLANIQAVLAEPTSAKTYAQDHATGTTDQTGVKSAPTSPPPAEPAPQDKSAYGAALRREAGQTMKIDAERIDLLLDTIGELVIAEAIVAGDPDIRALKSLRVEKSMALLSKITRSLQDMGMSMRMVPIDPVFRKMARLVRDLSRKSSKEVELQNKGGDTEIDKSMVEKLGDPLVHMIRNSIDHGIETVTERESLGKPAAGTVILRAYHKGGNIHIDIEDDGKGLDKKAIIAKAVERGLIRNGDGMSDQEVFSLIFAAGFSTAGQVTEISGRGVGMDVVQRNIEELRGNILIRSTSGKGAVFTLVLPLTTAIIDGMLARVGDETYILPTLSIVESFRPSREQVHKISGKGEMVKFRGTLLPMFRLSNVFETPQNATHEPCAAIVMVIEEYGKQWGLMVDEIIGQQQVVIKSLGHALNEQAPGIAGASILADGRPGLILDIAAVIRLATGNEIP